MTVISIDLAYKRFSDFGVAILHRDGPVMRVKLDTHRPAGLPTPANTSDWIAELAVAHDATHVLLDGPQGWKSEASSLVHSRACERELNTPAKTGINGVVKPRNYTAFAEFSIDVFELLTRNGHVTAGAAAYRFEPRAGRIISTWRVEEAGVDASAREGAFNRRECFCMSG